MKPYRAVLFDMDGTLIDSFRFHAQVIYSCLRGYGYAVELRQVEKNIGNTITCVLDGCGVPRGEQQTIIDGLDDFYLTSAGTGDIQFIPGVACLLAELKKNGVQTGILSNSKQALVDAIVSRNGASGLVDHVFGATSDTIDKEQRCRLAFHKMGLSARDVLYVGDTVHDVRLARNAGMDICILRSPIGWELDYERLISSSRPDFVCDSIDGLNGVTTLLFNQ